MNITNNLQEVRGKVLALSEVDRLLLDSIRRVFELDAGEKILLENGH